MKITNLLMNRFAVPIIILIYSIFAIVIHASINDLFLRFMILISGCFYLLWSCAALWLEITSRKPKNMGGVKE